MYTGELISQNSLLPASFKAPLKDPKSVPLCINPSAKPFSTKSLCSTSLKADNPLAACHILFKLKGLIYPAPKAIHPAPIKFLDNPDVL